MAHGRTLQHWNQWLEQHFLGHELIKAEERLLSQLLNRHLGKHATLIGVPNQQRLLEAVRIPVHSLISPVVDKEPVHGYVEGDCHELPLLTGSVDLVILPHTLEFIDNPRQLLSEACRIIKPEGLIVIYGFNPYSIWGLKKIIANQKTMPWTASFIRSHLIKNWLKLLDFALEEYRSILFRPPLRHKKFYHHLHFLEQIGRKCFPLFGGIYLIISRAKVIPLTPIRLKWKQQLSGISIASKMTGHIARQFKHNELEKQQ